MRKLRLSPDQLRVETFDPARIPEDERGTVFGKSTDNIRWCSDTYCQECTNWSCLEGQYTCDGAFC